MSSGSNRQFPLRSLAAGLALGCVLLAGCRDRKPAADQATADDSPPASDGAKVVRVMLDDTVVAQLTMAEVEKRPSLVDLMPPEARDMRHWKLIEAKARQPEYEYLALPKPARNFPDQVPRIFLDRKGRVAFGMEKAGDQPYFTTMRSGIKAVLVHTRGASTNAPPSGSQGDLLVELGDTKKTITAAQLEAIPKIPDADRDTDGWYLRDLLALVTPVADIAKVTFTAVDKSVEVDAAELVDDKLLAVVKINRRGLFRFKMWRIEPDGKRSLVKDGRDLVRLEITPKG